MTDRSNRPATGAAAKLFATGASVAAGLGLIGLIEAQTADAAPVGSPEISAPPVTIVRRVIVPTTVPDVLLQSAMGESKIVIQEAPAPIIRTRSVPGRAPSAPAPSQSKSSGS